jgi:hypothetical protein
MTGNAEELELKERLNLIESMIAEGRSSTQRWAWSFLLWGIAYYVAIAWSTWGKTGMAWPVTMIAAAIVTSVFASRVTRGQPGTTVGRVMSAIWSVMGTVLFVVLMALGFSGRADLHLIVAIVGAMLATANGVSSIVRLRGGLAGPRGGSLLYNRYADRHAFSRSHLFLPDRLRDIWNSARVSQAEPECQPCLSCQI